MARKAPGKAHRKGITLMELTRMFPDDATAERWFIEQRWPDGVHCPACGSTNVQERPTRKPQPYRCRDCRKDFSTKTGTLMQGSNLGFQTWAMAIYLFNTSLKGVSSMKLHRDLGITQKSAWHLAHRIRETWQDSTDGSPFAGPVEVDETYMGGKMKNMHADKRRAARQKPDMGKTIVAGAKDRATGAVRAQTIEAADKKTLTAFINAHAVPGATIYTDEGRPYSGLPNRESVTHSKGEYYRDGVSTNGVESFWSMLKRGHVGTYHKMSPKHMDRYVGEFAGRHNGRERDTIKQMAGIVEGMAGKRLRYQDLIADNGLSSGARSG